MTRKAVADSLGWPQTKIELIETGRIKIGRPLITDLIATYGLQNLPNLASRVDAATEPADADALFWITSHVFRKTTATALDDSGQTARQILNTVALFNTRYIDLAVNALREQRYPVRDEDAARLSPLGYGHINMLGVLHLSHPVERTAAEPAARSGCRPRSGGALRGQRP